MSLPSVHAAPPCKHARSCTHQTGHSGSDGSLVRRRHQPITAGQTDARLAGSEGLNEDLGGSRAVLVGPRGRLHQRFQCCFKPGTTGAAERSSANKSNNLINTNGMFNDIFPFQRNSRGVFSTRESSRQTKTRLQDPGSWIPPLPYRPLPSPLLQGREGCRSSWPVCL